MSIEPRPSDPAKSARRPHSTSIWPTRRDLTGCYVTVCRSQPDLIDVCIPGSGGFMYGHALTRQEARMLARRINQCLDASVKP